MKAVALVITVAALFQHAFTMPTAEPIVEPVAEPKAEAHLQKRGGFGLTCQSISISESTLSAWCVNDGHQLTSSHLDLNNCMNNNNGVLYVSHILSRKCETWSRLIKFIVGV